MRKIRVYSIILLVTSMIVFGAYVLYTKMTSDTEAPVVSCESDTIEVSVSVTEEELLAGVTAVDDKSKDVTNTLVIEKMSAFTDENSRTVTYAAIDESGNVGRLQRTVKYTDYEKPTFGLTEPLRFRTGYSFDLLENVTAKSTLDGDLTNGIKYTQDSVIDLYEPGTYTVEFRVADSTGHVEYLPLEIELYDVTKERISVVLSEYLVYVPLNGDFDPDTYFVGSDIDGKLEIESDVDVTQEGIYTVDYVVNGENSIGKSRLVVIVTGS